MEGVERTTSDMSEDTAAKTEKNKGTKIALVPFVEAGPPVHLLDAAGKTFPARCGVPSGSLDLRAPS